MELLVAVLIVLGALTLSGERAAPAAPLQSDANQSAADAADRVAPPPCAGSRVRDLTRSDYAVLETDASESAHSVGVRRDD